jgi:hypothetical protein
MGVGGGGGVANKLWEATHSVIKIRNNTDFFMVSFFNLNYKFGAKGTELVGGGVGGGGGGGPAAINLAAPKPATINTAHKHNFKLFIINPLSSANCLNFILNCLKMRITNQIARLVPKTRLFSVSYASS